MDTISLLMFHLTKARYTISHGVQQTVPCVKRLDLIVILPAKSEGLNAASNLCTLHAAVMII